MKNIKKYCLENGYYLVVLFLSFSLYACNNDDNGNGKDVISQQDKEFVKDAGHANRAEIEMGELASTKSTNEDIIAFAEFMVSEHTNAQNKLKELANKKNIAMPDTLDAAHKTMKDMLSALDGYKFDSAYISSQVADHEKAEKIFRDGDDDNDDDELESYASETLNHIRQHLERAKELKGKIVDNGPCTGC